MTDAQSQIFASLKSNHGLSILWLLASIAHSLRYLGVTHELSAAVVDHTSKPID